MADASLAFPLRIDTHGRFQLISGRDAVEEAFRSILLTVAGERVMRPELGIRLDWQTAELPDRIGELLTEAERRASISRVQVGTPNPQPWATHLAPVAFLTVEYELRQTGDHHVFQGVIDWSS